MALDALEEMQAWTRAREGGLFELIKAFEKDLIIKALEETKGNQIKAAKLLGVKHTTLNTKIKKLRIQWKKLRD